MDTDDDSSAFRLVADDIEQIARRVVELLHEDGAARASRLVDAATVARELGVERDWVYLHARALGGVRLGGPRGRLRFDLPTVRERLAEGHRGDTTSPGRSHRAPARAPDPMELLPIHLASGASPRTRARPPRPT